MNKTQYILVALSTLSAGCSLIQDETVNVARYNDITPMAPMISNEKRLKSTIVNDYETYQQVNYSKIKANNEDDQLRLLTSQVEHVVMDLIANLDENLIETPVIIRPVTFSLNERYNTSAGQVLIESSLEFNLKKFGFDVFNDRNPKGKLGGDEYVLDTFITSINDKIILQSTLKYLDSNKIEAVRQSYISEYFFKNITDGVEVWRTQE